MRRIIIFGCILAAFSLLMLPSITAIQHNTLENKLQENTNNDDDEKWDHRLLFLFVFSITISRFLRGHLLWKLSGAKIIWKGQETEPDYPLIYLRSKMLIKTGNLWIDFWCNIADELGWKWGYN